MGKPTSAPSLPGNAGMSRPGAPPLFRLRDWEAETIDLPNHPYVAFTETAGKIRWKQSALLEVGDQVVLLLDDDQTAYLIAKVVPA